MLIAFTGYGMDFIVRGRVEVDGMRLTDMLEQTEQILVRDAVLEGLDDLAHVELPEYLVPRSELLAALGGGPRGSHTHRIRATPHRIQASVGPYRVLGRLHTPGDASIAQRLHEGGPLVPLTDATIAYVIAGILEVRDASVVYVNRDLASWVRPEPYDVSLASLVPVPTW